MPGQGSQYIGAYQDADGNWLTGDNSYRIHLPKDVPANMFWSLTVYDNDTRSMIQNEHGRPLVGSVHGAVPSEDGSFDLYFGPKLPADVPEENWVETMLGKGWFTYLRLYGPEAPYFEKTWIPRGQGDYAVAAAWPPPLLDVHQNNWASHTPSVPNQI